MLAYKTVGIEGSVISYSSSLVPAIKPPDISCSKVKDSLCLCFSSSDGGFGMYKIPLDPSNDGLTSLYFAFNCSMNSLSVLVGSTVTSIFVLLQTKQFCSL